MGLSQPAESSSGLQAFIDGKQTKQTTQVLTATNARQTPNGWVCPNPRSPPAVCKHSLTANRPSRLLKFRRPSMSDKPLMDGSVPTHRVLQQFASIHRRKTDQADYSGSDCHQCPPINHPGMQFEISKQYTRILYQGRQHTDLGWRLRIVAWILFNANMSNKPQADGSAPTHLMSLDINRTRANNTAFGG
ncbi:uncharacterized protein F5147DRAFT_766337 [Suillus discolor]|uniref:Uncharacterized protein n=1 Tax=Suillus discolor TaxID=1912936 RepID=A0A9P7FLV3_9AGAM|nr:uncharacterized protein F5147DRAFT_766337 [Suillus discolor]KAG2120421.1 hypothetical protein F5147DRAFT_766337 [Suillus discolor]